MDLSIIFINFVYAVSGAFLTILFMMIGYVIFDKMTPYDAGKELEKGNTAVGIVVGSIFIAIGVAMGLVVGMGLN